MSMSWPEGRAHSFDEFLEGFHQFFPEKKPQGTASDAKIDEVALARFLKDNREYLSSKHIFRPETAGHFEKVIHIFEQTQSGKKEAENVPLEAIKQLTTHLQPSLDTVSGGTGAPVLKKILEKAGKEGKAGLGRMSQVSKKWQTLSQDELVKQINEDPEIPLVQHGLASYKKVLAFVEKNGSKLTCLNLLGLFDLDNEKFKTLLKLCPNLTDVYHYPDEEHPIHDDAFALLKEMPLKTLSLISHEITDDAIAELSNTQITRLDLLACHMLTDKAVSYIEGLPLTDLELSESIGISEEARERIVTKSIINKLVTENLMTKEEATSIPANILPYVVSNEIREVLRNRYITPQQLAELTLADFTYNITYVLTDGITLLKEKLVTLKEAVNMPLEHLKALNSDYGKYAIKNRLIRPEDVHAIPIENLRFLLSDNEGIRLLQLGYVTQQQAADLSIEALKILSTRRGIATLQQHLLTAEQASFLPVGHLKFLISERGWKLLQSEIIVPEQLVHIPYNDLWVLSKDKVITLLLENILLLKQVKMLSWRFLNEILEEPLYTSLLEKRITLPDAIIEHINKEHSFNFSDLNMKNYDQVFEFLKEHGNKITCLNLQGFTQDEIDNNQFITLLKLCPNLTAVIVNGLSLQKDAFLMLQKLPLTTLYLYQCREITDDDVALFKGMQIRNLSLVGCENVTEEIVPTLKNMPLENVDLVGTAISQKAREEIDFQTYCNILVKREKILTQNEVETIPVDTLDELATDDGIWCLRNKLISPEQAVTVDRFLFTDVLNSPSGKAVLEKHLISWEQLMKIPDDRRIDIDFILEYLLNHPTSSIEEILTIPLPSPPPPRRAEEPYFDGLFDDEFM